MTTRLHGSLVFVAVEDTGPTAAGGNAGGAAAITVTLWTRASPQGQRKIRNVRRENHSVQDLLRNERLCIRTFDQDFPRAFDSHDARAPFLFRFFPSSITAEFMSI